MSADNILHEICEDKGKKHKGSDTDLLIFVLDGEMDPFKHLIETHLYNSASDSFFKSIINSPFRRIFLCEWDYFQKKYILENPELFLLEVKNGGVEWKKL